MAPSMPALTSDLQDYVVGRLGSSLISDGVSGKLEDVPTIDLEIPRLTIWIGPALLVRFMNSGFEYIYLF